MTIPQKNMVNNGSLDPSTGWWTWFESHGVTSLVKNHVRNKLLIPWNGPIQERSTACLWFFNKSSLDINVPCHSLKNIYIYIFVGLLVETIRLGRVLTNALLPLGQWGFLIQILRNTWSRPRYSEVPIKIIKYSDCNWGTFSCSRVSSHWKIKPSQHAGPIGCLP